MAAAKKKLGEILLEMGAIDPLQLQSALGHQQQWGGKLGKVVVESRFCSSDDVLRALCLQTGHPVLNIDAYALGPELAKLLPQKTAERFLVVPLQLKGKRQEELVVAVAAPAGLETLDALRAASGKKILPHLAWDDAVDRAIGRVYRGEQAMELPAAGPLGEVPMASMVMLELEGGEEQPAKPVMLYGWHDASGRALGAMLKRGSVDWKLADDDALDLLQGDDVVIASTLSLQAVLPRGTKLGGKLIIAGMPADSDVDDAKAVGARVYLRPPFSTEQLCGAVRKLRSAS